MQMSENGMALLKQFEGCKLKSYQDSTGTWTIGYGWTQAVDGKPIKQGLTIDQATAERLLHSGVVAYEQAINQLVTVPLTQNQFDALTSLVYNIGWSALSTSTLLQKLNAKDYAGAADEFLRWNKAKVKGKNKNRSQVVVGLVKRRAAERQLFLS